MPDLLEMPDLGSDFMPNLGIKRMDGKKTTSVRRSMAFGSSAPTVVADALFTKTQQRVLGLLFAQPERSFPVGELIALSGAGSGAVQRELARLVGAGLLNLRAIGSHKRYRANPGAPIYSELIGIVQKTSGLAQPLLEALAPVAPNIVAALVLGPLAPPRGTAASDIPASDIAASDIAASDIGSSDIGSSGVMAGGIKAGSIWPGGGRAADIDLLIVSDTIGYAEVFGALEPVAARIGRVVNPTLHTRKEFAERLRDSSAFAARVVAQPGFWLIGHAHEFTG